jgi:hypothetical protein
MMVHDPDVSLPSPGSVQEVRSPDSSVLSRRCDSLMPVSLLFVAFDPRYHGGTRPRFRSPHRRVRSMRGARSLLTRPLQPGIIPMETSGSPKFPWSLLCPFAHAHATPAGQVSLTMARHPCCPRSFNDEGSDDSTVEAQLHGFRTRCLRFVVQVTHTPRKTRSRLLVRLYRTGLPPAKAPLKGFRLNFS